MQLRFTGSIFPAPLRPKKEQGTFDSPGPVGNGWGDCEFRIPAELDPPDLAKDFAARAPVDSQLGYHYEE